MLRRVGVAVVLCTFALAIAAASRGAASTSGVTATQMVRELKRLRWPDGRIVSGVECVGNGGVLAGVNAQVRSTRFVCLVQAWHRRPAVSAVLWRRLETAFETGDVSSVYRLLGLQPGATQAQVQAASDRVLGRNTPGAVGAKAVDATHVKLERSPIPASWFARALTARHAMLVVAVAMEAWYADHQTYAGVTAARLRAAPYSTAVPRDIRIASALASSYCLEATVGPATWSERGPGGYPAVARCR